MAKGRYINNKIWEIIIIIISMLETHSEDPFLFPRIIERNK